MGTGTGVLNAHVLIFIGPLTAVLASRVCVCVYADILGRLEKKAKARIDLALDND